MILSWHVYRPFLAITRFLEKGGSGADYRFVDIEAFPSTRYSEVRIISTFVKPAVMLARSSFAPRAA
jgi:hypothetical protein